MVAKEFLGAAIPTANIALFISGKDPITNQTLDEQAIEAIINPKTFVVAQN